MSPRKKAQAAFASALMLLALSALATYFATTRLLQSQEWVIHTHEVRAAIGDIDSAVSRAGRARSGFVNDGTDAFLNQFEAAASEVSPAIQHLRYLTRDNPEQQQLCSRLEDAAARRVALLRNSIQLQKTKPGDEQGQTDLSRAAVPISSDITLIMQLMREQEQHLLETREKTSRRFLIVTVVTLSVSFVLALELFAINYRLLSAELMAREQAELAVRESEESLRRLTGRLLQLQDAERRKFSRELHDSLGQYLAGAKMNLEIFIAQRRENSLPEAIHLLDEAIAETRTISHLLHPPLLDEAGLSSAARWYLEGFSQRSGIDVKFDLPEEASTLSRPIALGLFRVLQESLTNIHRHSGSPKAEVNLMFSPGWVTLKVRDYGKGIAQSVLVSFQTKGTNPGVGLAGMRERMRDLGGRLSIQPCEPGVLISAAIPLAETRIENVQNSISPVPADSHASGK
jgi:signal transduction histidine kinase